MLEKAIKKLKAEIDGSKNNSNIQAVGKFMLHYLELCPEASEQVLKEGKTLKGSIDEMKKIAKTKAVDGCGMITDNEGFGIVLKYFDIKRIVSEVTQNPIEVVKDTVAPIAQNKKSDIDFNVELDF